MNPLALSEALYDAVCFAKYVICGEGIAACRRQGEEAFSPEQEPGTFRRRGSLSDGHGFVAYWIAHAKNAGFPQSCQQLLRAKAPFVRRLSSHIS
jgi:hypothetical protein